MQQEWTQETSEVKWEVVCVTFMRHFHAQTLTVEDVSPRC